MAQQKNECNNGRARRKKAFPTDLALTAILQAVELRYHTNGSTLFSISQKGPVAHPCAVAMLFMPTNCSMLFHMLTRTRSIVSLEEVYFYTSTFTQYSVAHKV